MKQKRIGSYAVFLLITAAVGGLSALVVQSGMPAYHTLQKPFFTPPDIVFPIVWSILYLLMAVGVAQVWNTHSRLRKRAIDWFALQLALNFLWNVWFFNQQLFLLSFVWLLALIFVLILMIRAFRRVDRTAALMQIPYLLWCCFAAVLNLGIFLLN